MKILLVNKFYYKKGGAEMVFFAQKQALEKAGHEVIVFSMHDKQNEQYKFEEYFVKNVDFQGKGRFLKFIKAFYSFEAKRNLRELINDEKPDIE